VSSFLLYNCNCENQRDPLAWFKTSLISSKKITWYNKKKECSTFLTINLDWFLERLIWRSFKRFVFLSVKCSRGPIFSSWGQTLRVHTVLNSGWQALWCRNGLFPYIKVHNYIISVPCLVCFLITLSMLRQEKWCVWLIAFHWLKGIANKKSKFSASGRAISQSNGKCWLFLA
jgi:hypothetical protein